MPCFDIIVIGASAGGVEALTQLVSNLPENLPASLFVVVHFPSNSISLLPAILNRRGHLFASHPQDKTEIQPGHIYVAPPDYHLLIRPGHIRLSRGPRENGHRPAIDTLFRSAARSYKKRVVGVILSGSRDDGTAGLAIIKNYGGLVIVQNPEEALFDGMPRSAIEHVVVDYVLKIADIPSLLVELANCPREAEIRMPEEESEQERESQLVAENKAALEQGKLSGNASMLTCPDCGGVLWELQEGNILRFRCHVGHAYSAESLLVEQADDLERALWSSIRALEEKAALARRMASQAQKSNRALSEAQFLKRAQEAEEHADLIRQVILQQQVESKEKNNRFLSGENIISET